MAVKIHRGSKRPRRLKQTRFTGTGTISSVTVSKTARNSIPASSKLFLYESTTMRLVKSTTSDASGDWSFTNLDSSRTYMLVTKDPQGTLNGTTVDWVTPT